MTDRNGASISTSYLTLLTPFSFGDNNNQFSPTGRTFVNTNGVSFR